MTARLVAGVLAVASMALAAGGCGAKEGQRVVEYGRGDRRVAEKKAGETGRYTLMVNDRPNVTFRVEKGEGIGFRRGRDGRVNAYAGENPAVELDESSARGAYWRFEQKSER